MPVVTFLECVWCGHRVAPETFLGVCPRDAGPLRVRYAPEALRRATRPQEPEGQAPTAHPGLWRYHQLLPPGAPVSLHAGWTPMTPSRQHPSLWVKDEGANPTGSWHARGTALAVAAARQLGVRHLALAAQGEQASALAAFAASAGVRAHLFVARGTSKIDYLQIAACATEVHLLETPQACTQRLAEMLAAQAAAGLAQGERWYTLADLAPFRFEGEKTLGFEIVEQCGWQYPDAILLADKNGPDPPTLAAAFAQAEDLGWVHGARPRLFTVVPDTPVREREPAQHAAEDLVPVDPAAAGDAMREWARTEGSLLADGFGVAAFRTLLDRGELQPAQRVVLINPAAAWKRTDTLLGALALQDPRPLPTSLPVGGIITPI